MNSEQFLINQGWRKGEGLRPGAIKKPVLVSRKKDNKGLGFDPQASEGWWERMFDGHLKSLDVLDKKEGKLSFKIDEEKKKRETSILYASFSSGGFINDTDLSESQPKSQETKQIELEDLETKRETKLETKPEKKSKEKKEKSKIDKKEKKEKKEKSKVEKKEKKEKKEIEKKDRKRKRDSETGSKKHKSK